MGDYNEDRQSIDTEAGWQKKQNISNERGIVEKIANHGHLNEASIYLNSIGIVKILCYLLQFY